MSSSRPLSPHLQVYKLPLPALMSITHRLTGVVLSSGTVLMAGFLIALASGPEAFAIAQICVSHPLGQIALFGYSLALFYHACNGIRHLFWDAGYGYDLKHAYISGGAVVFSSLFFTILTWLIIYFKVN